MQSLSLTTTITGKKKLFVPLHDYTVLMYVCGITPYDFAHVGHGRCYTTFDLLYRLLRSLGYQVKYCRNFTDIDDKLLNRAQRELGDAQRYPEIAQKYIAAYHEDMQKLHCLPPTFEPLVTHNIPQIIAMIEALVANGYAYVVGGNVYYRVKKFADYGKLSHRKLDDLKVGARVAISEEKEDPLDFALWKVEAENTFWQSPWGYGRPGWHIECSALALAYLGKTIDIHGGGMDLIFPHHENEIAQSEGMLGQEFARYWVHNAFVRIDKEKMSKSLGNFFTLRDVFAKFDPMVVRYYFLQHHYRSPLDFAWDDLEAAQKSYQRLCKVFAGAAMGWKAEERVPQEKLLFTELVQTLTGQEQELVQNMINFLCDDLNTPGMFGVIFENLHTIAASNAFGQAVYQLLRGVLGLALEPLPEKQVEITPEIQQLLDERDAARKEKNWKRSDELRDQLKALGIDVQDRKL